MPIGAQQQDLFSQRGESLPVSKAAKRVAARVGTFTDNMKLPVHRWFRYSAGFSAEWAEAVIRDRKPRSVLDPFVGSGTTVLAAQAAGTLAVGYESHPFMARVAGAKVGWKQPEDQVSAAAASVLKVAEKYHPLPRDVPDLLGRCYTKDALQALYALREGFESLEGSATNAVRELMWLALTSILRTTSFAGTAQWQYVLPTHPKAKPSEPFAAFRLKVAHIVEDIARLRSAGVDDAGAIVPQDARLRSTYVKRGSIDLVVTSPPYPNNYDYADATRLEMTFWDEIRGWGDLRTAVRPFLIRSCSQHAGSEVSDLTSILATPILEPIENELRDVCERLAEVRKSKGGKKQYHLMVAAYFLDLAKVFDSLRDACAPGAEMCFVIGDSAPYGVYVPVEKWLGECALNSGFHSYSFEKIRDRNIKWKNRKHRVPLHEGRLWIKG